MRHGINCELINTLQNRVSAIPYRNCFHSIKGISDQLGRLIDWLDELEFFIKNKTPPASYYPPQNDIFNHVCYSPLSKWNYSIMKLAWGCSILTWNSWIIIFETLEVAGYYYLSERHTFHLSVSVFLQPPELYRWFVPGWIRRRATFSISFERESSRVSFCRDDGVASWYIRTTPCCV